MGHKRGAGLVFLVSLALVSGVQTATAKSLKSNQDRMVQETNIFMGELKADLALSSDSAFSDIETLGVGDYACNRFGQTLEGKRVVGVEAKICFSSTAEPIDRGAKLCDGACADRKILSTLSNREVRFIAERELRAALEKDATSRGLSRNPFGVVSKTDLEEAWLPDESTSQVRGGFVVALETVNPMGKFVAYIDGSTGELVAYENKIMNANGSSQTLVFNPNTKKQDLIPATLEGLLSIDKLESAFWSVSNEDSPSASSADGDYVFDPSDTHFAETQIYYAMQVAMGKFRKWGYEPFGSLPIVAHYGTRYNNAFYDGTMIAIGDGDGEELLDLAKDNTIVTHEYGHAIIDHLAHVLTIPKYGDGPAFHEGHADYIACAVYNDPAVGLFVMPSGEPMRRCDTDLSWSKRKGEAHAAGEVWSGALWEARETVSKNRVDVMAIDALMRIKTTGFLGTVRMEDAYAAVLNSDKIRFKGEDVGKIRAIFQRRGFESDPIKIEWPSEWPWPRKTNAVASK